MHKALELRPETVVKLFNTFDVWRKPQRFEEFLLVCLSDTRGRTGFENKEYPQIDYLKALYQAALAVDVQQVIADGFEKQGIRDRINASKNCRGESGENTLKMLNPALLKVNYPLQYAQFFSKYFVMKLLKSLLAPVFASVILSACTLDAERPTDVQHIDKNDITWQQHLKKIKQIQSYSTKGQIGYISPQERFSSRFEWQYQNPKAYKLKL